MSNSRSNSEPKLDQILENKFRFLDIFDSCENDEHYCDVTIAIRVLIYESGLSYYDITYSYDFSGDDNEAKRAHPFNYNRNIIMSDGVNGVIVKKNSLTDQLVRYLLMDVDELKQCIGITWWIQYKIQIMEALNLFWD